MEKKEVEMKVEKQPAQKKLTYEELENVCHQLSEQSRNLYERLREADMTNLFKRLDYLFAVVEHIDKFPKDFGKKCIDEIVESMTVPEAAEEKKEQ